MKYLIQNTTEFEDKLIRTQLKNTDVIAYAPGSDVIPIGDIDFVTAALKQAYPNFDKPVPIEIPIYLQTPEFLKRTYKIGTWKDIPETGRWFIKDASELKSFSLCSNMDFWYNEEIFDYKPKHEYDMTLSLSKAHDYVISSPVKILSEFRVYVINRNIIDISFYKGDPTILPDVNLIKKAVQLINENEEYLKSYTIDVMITPKGTALIEIHNFSSIGLYTTIFDHDLLLAYEQGIDYLLKDNSIKYKEVII